MVAHHSCKVDVEGSSPFRRSNGGVAQLREHLLCKQRVAGLNPVASTKEREATMSDPDHIQEVVEKAHKWLDTEEAKQQIEDTIQKANETCKKLHEAAKIDPEVLKNIYHTCI